MYASDSFRHPREPGGGQIIFSPHGCLLSVGFAAIFNEDGSDAVDVAGVLRRHDRKDGPRSGLARVD